MRQLAGIRAPSAARVAIGPLSRGREAPHARTDSPSRSCLQRRAAERVRRRRRRGSRLDGRGRSHAGRSGGQRQRRPRGAIDVAPDEWSVEAAKATASAGTVVFNPRNVGEAPHELEVISTDTPAGDFPVEAARAQVEGEEVGEVEGIAGGQSKVFEVDLEAGHYALICNIPRPLRARDVRRLRGEVTHSTGRGAGGPLLRGSAGSGRAPTELRGRGSPPTPGA